MMKLEEFFYSSEDILLHDGDIVDITQAYDNTTCLVVSVSGGDRYALMPMHTRENFDIIWMDGPIYVGDVHLEYGCIITSINNTPLLTLAAGTIIKHKDTGETFAISRIPEMNEWVLTNLANAKRVCATTSSLTRCDCVIASLLVRKWEQYIIVEV